MTYLKNKGFGMVDIILGFALFSVICVPVIMFVHGYDPLRGYDQKRSIPLDDPYKGFYVAGELRDSFVSITALNEIFHPKDYASIKSCDLALAPVAMEKTDKLMASITYLRPYVHDRNIPTTLSVQTAGSSLAYLFLGTNSASTTDPDLYVFTLDESTDVPQVHLIKEMRTGPGIIGMSTMPGTGYVIERSLVSPLWKLDLATLTATSQTRTGLALVSTSSFASAVPKTLEIDPDYVLVGAEKSMGPELFVFNQADISAFPNADTSLGQVITVPVQTVEIDAGINDMRIMSGSVALATSKNPEVEIFGLESALGSLFGARLFQFDAPGSSGNGKSIVWSDFGLGLGRTVGNNEFVGLHGAAGWIYEQLFDSSSPESIFPLQIPDHNSGEFRISSEYFNPNVSIRHALLVHGGRLAVYTNQTGVPAFTVIERDSDDSYKESLRIELPQYVSDIDCTSDNIVLALESTTTPIAVIQIGYE